MFVSRNFTKRFGKKKKYLTDLFAVDLKFFCRAGAVELRCARTVKTDRVRVGTASFYLWRKPSNSQILIINTFRKLERPNEKSFFITFAHNLQQKETVNANPMIWFHRSLCIPMYNIICHFLHRQKTQIIWELIVLSSPEFLVCKMHVARPLLTTLPAYDSSVTEITGSVCFKSIIFRISTISCRVFSTTLMVMFEISIWITFLHYNAKML